MQAENKVSMLIRKSDGMSIIKPKTSYYEQASDRLLFRSMTADDIPLWTPFFFRDDYMHFLMQDITQPTEERAKVWIDRQMQRENDGQFGQLAIIEKSSGTFIGVGGVIHRALYGKDELEITYSLLPDFWGNGYARELAKHFMEYVHQHSEAKSVISMIHPENQASIQVAKANGLSFDRKAKFMGVPVDVYRLTF